MPDLKEQLRSKLSHDLRSKINVVLGYCDLVSEDIEESANTQAAEDLATIRRACEDLLLTNDEIRLVLNEDREPLPTGEISLESLVRPVDDELQRARGTSPLTFSGLDDANVPAGLEHTLRSLLRKIALAFPAGCSLSFGVEASRLTIEFEPLATDGTSLEGFVSRYAAGDAPDPKNDFDLFFAIEMAELDGVEVDARLDDGDERARITIDWR